MSSGPRALPARVRPRLAAVISAIIYIYDPIKIKLILNVKGSLLKYRSAFKSVKPFLRLA